MRLFYLALMVQGLGLCAAWEPSERSRRWMRMLALAWDKTGLQRKEIAGHMRVTEVQLSKGLSMLDGARLPAAWIGELPDEAWLSMASEICNEVGGARVVRDPQIIALMQAIEDLRAPREERRAS